MGDTELVDTCHAIRPRLVGSLTLYCGDRAVAEELAQDALVRLWEHWSEVRAMASPEAWTFRVGTNLARSWLRRGLAERRARTKAGAPDRVDDPDHAADMALRAAVAALPPRQRAVIVARYYLGYDVAGTAAALGCAPGTVKATTHQALASLRSNGLLAAVVVEAAPLDDDVEVV